MTRTSLGFGLLLSGLSIALFAACSSGSGSSPSSGGAGGAAGSGTGGTGTGGTGTGGTGTGGTSGGGNATCASVCTKFASANCPNAEPQNVCEADCAQLMSACQAETQAFGDCIESTGSVSCSSDGDLTFSGCDTQMQSFLKCSACTALGGDDACEACSKNHCCSERQTLYGDPNLMPFINCFNACGDTTCMQGCATQYPSVFSAAQAVSNCEDQNCASQCSAP